MSTETVYTLGIVAVSSFAVTVVIMLILIRMSEKKWAKIKEEEKKSHNYKEVSYGYDKLRNQ